MSQQINLFNPIFLKQKKYFSALAILQALGLVILGFALFYGYMAYQVNLLIKQSDETSKFLNAEQAKLARFSAGFSPKQSSQLLEDELQPLEAKLAAQRNLIETMKIGAIGNTTGYAEYMRAFARQTLHGLWLTSFTITGDAARMSMSGAALSPGLVPAYIHRLGQEEVMHGKSFATLQIRRGGKEARYIEFTLQSGASDEDKEKKE